MKIGIFLLVLLLIPLVSSQVNLGESSLQTKGVVIEIPEAVTNFSIQNVNSSEWWDDLNTPADIVTGDITSFNQTYDEYGGVFVNLSGNEIITGDLGLSGAGSDFSVGDGTVRINDAGAGTGHTWLALGVLGGVVPIGQIVEISGQLVFQSLSNLPLTFCNDDVSGCFRAEEGGNLVARSLTDFRVENATTTNPMFEVNTTSGQFNVPLFVREIGSFLKEALSIKTQNLTTQDVNVSGEWESGFTGHAHCSESKFGAGEAFIPCGEFATAFEGIIMLQNGSITGYSTSVSSVSETDLDINVLLENGHTEVVYINHTTSILSAGAVTIIQTTVPRGTHKFKKGDSIVCLKSSSGSIIGSATCDFEFVYDSNIKLIDDVVSGVGGE